MPDDLPMAPRRTHPRLKSPRQAGKYLLIGRRLTAEETKDKTQGVEVMHQISMAPPVLRPLMWRLAEEERLSSGALSAGRLAAAELVRKERIDKAIADP